MKATSSHLRTRSVGVEQARRALRQRGAQFTEASFHGPVLKFGNERSIVVRVKTSSGAKVPFPGDLWPWSAPPIRYEDFYLFVDTRGPRFWIVPTDFVCGVVEGRHQVWYRNDEAKRDSNPMRVMDIWSIRRYEDRWDLLGLPAKPERNKAA